jgi:Ser/Thr protein kinase RdoA (MazF antagonist)
MLSINTILWDLADLIRSYMKIEIFNRKKFEILINSYNSIRKLTRLENEELKNYCTMMILDT